MFWVKNGVMDDFVSSVVTIEVVDLIGVVVIVLVVDALLIEAVWKINEN